MFSPGGSSSSSNSLININNNISSPIPYHTYISFISIHPSHQQQLFIHRNLKMVFNSLRLPASSLLLLLLPMLCSCGPSSGNDAADLIYSQCLKVPVSEFLGSVKSTMDAVQEVSSVVSQFGDIFGDFRLSNAVSDCLDLLDFSSEELSWTLSASQNSNQGGGKVKGNGTGNLSSDLRTWLSGALVNQDTCIDGFDGTNSFIKPIIVGGLSQISSLLLQILGQVHETSATTAAAAGKRKLTGNYPSWLSGTDRRLLQSTSGLSPDAVVALDGSGDFETIADAVAAAPALSTQRFVIYVKKGLYKEYVEISKKKWNIMMIGDGMDATIISGNRSFIGGWTTYRSATFAVKGRGFIARDITFENTAGPEMHQAVAFRSDSDLSVLFRCGMRGYQDTLYAHSMRQFYRECRISGTVDFIFGDGTVVFQSCQILARKGLPNQKNTITAQGRKDPSEPTGFSIQFSNITAEPELLASLNNTQTYLGRPWKLYSRTMIMQSYISPAIRPEGWLEWNGDFALDTLWYGEYMNYGPSAGLGGRIKWPGFHGLNDSSQASNFTVAQFILGNSWLPSTGVKYTAGFAL